MRDLIRDREFRTACVLPGKPEYVCLTSQQASERAQTEIGQSTSSGPASARGGRGRPPIFNPWFSFWPLLAPADSWHLAELSLS